MGNKSSEIKIEGDLFSKTLREAQRAYRSKEWDKFMKIFADNKVDLLKDFDLLGNTAITMAARSHDPEILKELLGNLSEEQKWRAFRKKSSQGNTLLHDIAVNCSTVAMADIVLDFENTTPLPPELAAEEEKEIADLELPEKEKEERKEEKRRPLLEWKNVKGETPVFKAAKFGKLKMLSHLVKRVDGGDMKIHQQSPGETILHASVNNQSFDVALWIIINMDMSSLVLKPNKNKLTCLQLLARMPSAFKSHYYDPQDWISKRVYNLLPKEGYDIEGCDSFGLLRPPVRDIETGGQDDARPPTPGYLSRANLAAWKCLAPAYDWIQLIQEEKKKHQLAERLAVFLVRCDYSWQHSYDERSDKTRDELPPILYNVAKRKSELKWKKKKKIFMEDTKQEDEKLEDYRNHPALLIAASSGIQEIIKLYINEHPESINHVSKDGQNLLHIAVRHRREKILDLLEEQPELRSLASQVDRENHTALHQVAGMDYYRGTALAGAAFQLQEELEWYKRVEKNVPPHLRLHCDNEQLTAGDLLDIQHDHMLADAQRWIKETAQSCSTVAVLVATVVFAAAYTIPGGTEGGSALLLKSPVFIFFTIMDIVALAFSLASVVMFLSILNAPFELWDFHESLPWKLSMGFTFLFLSLTTTMLAFSATILITIRLQWKEWTSTLVYGAALFPVTIFAMIEFPLYEKIPRLFHKLYKKIAWLFPKLFNNKKVSFGRSGTRDN